MKENRKKSLKKEIKKISKITLEAQSSFLIVEYLLKDEKDDDKSYEKNMNTFLYFSKISFWQKAVLELSKIYLDREKFSLIKLIRKLKNDGEYSKAKIPNEKLQEWSEHISHNEIVINNLKEQRDKVYAHEDGRADSIVNIASLSQIKDLISLSFKITNEVRKHIGLYYLQPELINEPATALKYCIDRLVKEKRTNINKLRKLAKEYGLENELPPE